MHSTNIFVVVLSWKRYKAQEQRKHKKILQYIFVETTLTLDRLLKQIVGGTTKVQCRAGAKGGPGGLAPLVNPNRHAWPPI